MTNNKKLFIYALLSFTLFLASLFLYTNQINSKAEAHQTAKQANTETLTAYEYTITSIDSEGLYGKSTSDNSGIYLTHENVKGLSLNKSDVIKVEFPKDNFETITSVVKVSNTNNLVTESFTITSFSNGQYQATNNHTGTDKAGLFFTVDDIQGNTSLSVNDQVKAYYKPLEGEDEFIKVVKVN
jgi:hypothetical protein